MNPHTKKQNCKRCKAFLKNSNGTPSECRLGYELIVVANESWGLTARGVPQEPCPKPKTYADYIYASNNLRAAIAKAEGDT